jgi:hypothetical protein
MWWRGLDTKRATLITAYRHPIAHTSTRRSKTRSRDHHSSPSLFAEEWYHMRELGEYDRAQVLSALYTRRPHPGGSHPDPRVPAAFSHRAILAAVARLKHDIHPAIILTDNYQVSDEARAFAHTLFARPDLHQRVKLVGIAVQRWEELAPLDEYLRMPFPARDLFELMDRLCATLVNGA